MAHIEHSSTELIGQKRWKIFALFLFFPLFALILYRLIQIQLLDRDRYKQQLTQQAYRTLPVYAIRGNLYDRNGEIFARTIYTLTLAVDPQILQKSREFARYVEKFVRIPQDSVIRKITAAKNRRFLIIARNLPLALDTVFEQLKDPGIIRIETPTRFYPFDNLAVQTIGFVDAQRIGRSGIEQYYDSVLRGEDGYRVYLRDAMGNVFPDPSRKGKPPRNGNALVLTLDHRIQQIVEKELRKGIENAAAESGIAIAMEPFTGEILAMASYPTFNPNDLTTFSPEAARNRAIADIYEPGSTIKAVTAAALLEEQLISPSDSVDGRNGTLRIKNHVIRDAHPLGKTDFRHALIHSSNVIFALLGKKLSTHQFYRYMRNFGFGLPTGIDLPGEARGILKKPEEFDATTQMFMSFGYELAATALQILNAYAAIANGGTLLRPWIVREIRDEHNQPLLQYRPQPLRRVLSPETADTLKHLLEQVVLHGTGKNAGIPGIRIAGKTGTAQQLINGKYSREHYTASFVGFFPVDTPKVALIIMLNKPQGRYYASQVAAPIFRNIAQQLLPLLVTQTAPVEKNEIRLPVKIPALYGLTREQAEKLADILRIRLHIDGASEGIILWQKPQPGVLQESDHPILIRFSSSFPKDSLLTIVQRIPWKGLTLQQALALTQLSGAIPIIHGSGRVKKVRWITTEERLHCIIETSQH